LAEEIEREGGNTRERTNQSVRGRRQREISREREREGETRELTNVMLGGYS